jgi:hypothetical protein
MAARPIPRPSVPFVDRFRNMTKVWYEYLKPLLETVEEIQQEQATTISNQQTAISNQQTAITQLNILTDEIGSQWGVSITGTGENAQLLGLVRLDVQDLASTFTVVADNFRVARAAGDNTVSTVFQAGQIQGVNSVGINGNLIVDRTIKADAIEANTITANEIAAGTITADEIEAGTITAEKLNADVLDALVINVEELSALSSNLGTVTAGTIQNAAGTIIMDWDNMRLYRTDETMEVDFVNKRIRIVT